MSNKAANTVYEELSFKEEHFMVSSEILLARNLATAVRLYADEGTEYRKERFVSILSEIRRLRIAEVYFAQTVNPLKQSDMWKRAERDDTARRSRISQNPDELVDKQNDFKARVKEAIEKNSTKALKKD